VSEIHSWEGPLIKTEKQKGVKHLAFFEPFVNEEDYSPQKGKQE